MSEEKETINSLIHYIKSTIDPDVSESDLSIENSWDEQTVEQIDQIKQIIQKKYIKREQVETKLETFMALLLDYAQHDYTKQAPVNGTKDSVFDGLGVSINMLGEELNYSTVTKNYLEDIFNSMDDILVVSDADGVIISANKAAREIIKLSDDDLHKRSINEFIDLDELKAGEKKDNYVLVSNDNTEHRVSLKISPFVRGDNRVIGSVIIARDISKLLEYQDKIEKVNEKLRKTNADLQISMEKAQESDRLKTSFLSNMSHEIRTPLNGICGFAQILLEDDLTREEQELYIDYIMNGGKRLTRILDDIIDISKIEANQLVMDKGDVDISELMQETYEEFKQRIDYDEKIKIELRKGNATDVVSPSIYADGARVSQILGNLIGNAIKYTSEGWVEFGYTDRENGFLEFYVKDTGIGIEEENFGLIFERFRQVNTGFTRPYDGNGLGLAVCKGLVEFLGGKIWVESVFGEGSTFYFTLPYESIHEPVKLTSSVIKENDINWAGKKILIVEDHEESFLILKHSLSFPGVEIIHASEGPQAIKILEDNNDIDIVLLDIGLPKMDGYKVAGCIKTLYPKLPIIAQTSNAMEGDKERSLDAGCVEYYAKPINVHKLIRSINEHLSSKEKKEHCKN